MANSDSCTGYASNDSPAASASPLTFAGQSVSGNAASTNVSGKVRSRRWAEATLLSILQTATERYAAPSGLCHPPEGQTILSHSFGPQVFGSYS